MINKLTWFASAITIVALLLYGEPGKSTVANKEEPVLMIGNDSIPVPASATRRLIETPGAASSTSQPVRRDSAILYDDDNDRHRRRHRQRGKHQRRHEDD